MSIPNDLATTFLLLQQLHPCNTMNESTIFFPHPSPNINMSDPQPPLAFLHRFQENPIQIEMKMVTPTTTPPSTHKLIQHQLLHKSRNLS